VVGSDYLADQDAVEILAREASPAIEEAIALGVPCNTALFGKGRRVYKTPNLTAPVVFDCLWRALDNVAALEHWPLRQLARNDDGRVVGGWFSAPGSPRPVLIRARSTILATGGASGLFPVATNRHRLTGRGMVLAYEAGCELADLEMTQFHPTTLPDGSLVSEVFRTAGAQLRNTAGERFMQDAAPHMVELAPPDVIARAIADQAEQGRALDGGFVMLDFSALPPAHRHICGRSRPSPSSSRGRRQIWRNSLHDRECAVRDYRRAVALGNTRTVPEVYRVAGSSLIFDEQPMRELIGLVERQHLALG
jgi:succinate dehydrogenase / fumarate reductase flavoprotein subunit